MFIKLFRLSFKDPGYVCLGSTYESMLYRTGPWSSEDVGDAYAVVRSEDPYSV